MQAHLLAVAAGLKRDPGLAWLRGYPTVGAADLAARGGERPLAKGRVEQDLCFHPVVDVGSQVLAELGKELWADRVRGTHRAIDADGPVSVLIG